ncbi:hypothetical protein AB205_0091580 [Aquarana catesbeiana]|uniref:Uncharacterized protein n=1 Tax=Aquarana catesbeiana TaxID=8400 RepID=A0A2G9QAN2_AQUCT|nr:hypothetical protein AB205_0091580 [Aquarana catesbeiana]
MCPLLRTCRDAVQAEVFEQRSKNQLRKRWSDLKLREHDQYRRIRRMLQKSDRDVVEEECHFTSESAQILIGEIMGYNRDLGNIKQNINDVQNKMKNIIDVLGRI